MGSQNFDLHQIIRFQAEKRNIERGVPRAIDLTGVRIAAGDRLIAGQLREVLLLANGLIDFLLDEVAVFLR